MKKIVAKYLDEDGKKTIHSFDEGISFSVFAVDLVFFIEFYDPALYDVCAIRAQIYVEPASPFVHMALMTRTEDFMEHVQEEVEKMVDNAVCDFIFSDRKILNLTKLCSIIYEELDELAEKYTDEYCTGLADQFYDEYTQRVLAERKASTSVNLKSNNLDGKKPKKGQGT